MIMHIKRIAAAAYSGTTKSSARIPTLLHHLPIVLLTVYEQLLFIATQENKQT